MGLIKLTSFGARFTGIHRKGNVGKRVLIAIALGEAFNLHQHRSGDARCGHCCT
jgi:hypothetical protein